jgi:putative transposase
MRLERPRIRDASRLGFESRILGKGVARTHALESLVISGFLRGLSTRDVEAALEEVFEEPIASKSTVSRICEDTRERYRQWCRRRLEAHDVVYLFLDAIYLKLRPDDTPSEGVLVCWGVTLEGRKILLGLALGSRESYDAWLAFGRDMIERGLRSPALVIADGAPGIWKATRELWPNALEQRCTVHYAEARVMPRWVVEPCGGERIELVGVGIIRVPRGRRGACRVAGSGRVVCRGVSFWRARLP